MSFLVAFLWILFSAAAVLLAAVVLIQDARGGGLAEAFGGAGGEVFGPKTTGVSRVTFLVAAVFVASALLIHAFRAY
jgi:protein translocase SecG subunit